MAGSLATVVRSYKGAVSRKWRGMLEGKDAVVWQRGYYERVIRNDRHFNEARKYIRQNPTRWDQDRYYREG